ncbi:MAG: urease accessory protein [Nitrospina sp.]|nr:urease accessory protein [Nitrospina sp.]
MTISSLKETSSNRGWEAKLQLKFIEENNKTILKHRSHQGPLQVQKVFYPETSGACHVYIIHPPGGVVGGDSFDVKIQVDSNAKVLVTTPAAGKFYRSASNEAFQHQTITVADHGVLEWFPSENIFFRGSMANLRTRVYLSSESHFIGWDILCLGRPSIDETFSQGQLIQKLEIFVNGRPVRLERLMVRENDAILDAKWGLGGKPVVGSFFCFSSRKDIVDLLRQNIALSENGDLFSITLLDGIILCRYLGNSVEHVKRNFIKFWQILRLALRDQEAVIPRIWNT